MHTPVIAQITEDQTMGARAKINKIELMVSLEHFFRRVGIIKNYYRLESLGLSDHDFSGMFPGDRLSQLTRFCERNPRYHIVSSVGEERFVNRVVIGADFYLIADGERDPVLELNFLLDPEWHVLWEDGISETLAEINNIKNG